MLDMGIRSTVPHVNVAILWGFKYNQWGQARNMGKQVDQWDSVRIGLAQPLKIKTVYSFCPYFGFQ